MGNANRITESEIARMKELYKNGMSCSKIGTELNRNESTIRNHLKKLGGFQKHI